MGCPWLGGWHEAPLSASWGCRGSWYGQASLGAALLCQGRLRTCVPLVPGKKGCLSPCPNAP